MKTFYHPDLGHFNSSKDDLSDLGVFGRRAKLSAPRAWPAIYDQSPILAASALDVGT